jgi:outer membrane protein TolC
MSELKVQADSVTLIANQNQDSIALNQFRRAQRLYEQGLYSQTDLENRRQKWQEARAKRISAERKLLSSRNGLLNAELEINNLAADFRQKISKARSERLSALSNITRSAAAITS